jgi:hypothetical protein
MFSEDTANTEACFGSTKEAITGYLEGKRSFMTSPVSSQLEPWVSNGVLQRRLGRPFERLDYHQSTVTAMFLGATAKTWAG